MTDIITKLEETIRQRMQTRNAEQSYVAQLSEQGLNKILEKLGEECIETIIAAKDASGDNGRESLINEVADLIFHLMVMLEKLDISFQEVTHILEQRMGVSGIEEKAARAPKE